eukprot:13929-Heterococcus_DN1.PRE.2
MARSDNVVRVALTPKYRDVPLLCEMLTYKMGAPPIVPPFHVSPCCTRFTPPVADFELELFTVAAGQEYVLDTVQVPVILMVLGGLGRATDDSTDSTSSAQSERSLWTGVSIFVPARLIGFTAGHLSYSYYASSAVTITDSKSVTVIGDLTSTVQLSLSALLLLLLLVCKHTFNIANMLHCVYNVLSHVLCTDTTGAQ